MIGAVNTSDPTAGASSSVPLLNLATGLPFPSGTSVSQAVASNSQPGVSGGALSGIGGLFAHPSNALVIIVGLVLAIAALIGSSRGTPVDVVKLASKVTP